MKKFIGLIFICIFLCVSSSTDANIESSLFLIEDPNIIPAMHIYSENEQEEDSFYSEDSNPEESETFLYQDDYEEIMIFEEVDFSLKELIIAAPPNNYSIAASSAYIIGSSDPNQPLTVNDILVERTDSGHFCLYVPLEEGKNIFTFSHKETVVEHVIERKSGSTASVSQNPTPEFTKLSFSSGSCQPRNKATYIPGEIIEFKAQAPAGSSVYVSLGDITLPLYSPQAKKDSMAIADFAGTYRIPLDVAIPPNGTLDMGSPIFITEMNGEKYEFNNKNNLYIQLPEDYKYATITSEQTYIRKTPTTTITFDYYPITKGMNDYIVAEDKNFVKLRFGGWVPVSDVTISKGELELNSMTSAEINADSESLNIVFAMTQNVPYTVEVFSDRFEFIIHNTSSGLAKPLVEFPPENPLIARMESVEISSTEYKYIFYLKKADCFVGFDVEYTAEGMILKLRIPKNASDGNRPLTGISVSLDPGHGGSDSGATGPMGKYGLQESDLNLVTALKVKKILEGLGATVYMTRSEDVNVELSERVEMVREWNPDLAISIHHDSMDYSIDPRNTFGVLSLYSYDMGKTPGGVLVNAVADGTSRKVRANRFQNLAVCREFRFPAILLELGMMCNANEYEWLTKESNINKTAYSIAAGVVEFFK